MITIVASGLALLVPLINHQGYNLLRKWMRQVPSTHIDVMILSANVGYQQLYSACGLIDSGTGNIFGTDMVI